MATADAAKLFVGENCGLLPWPSQGSAGTKKKASLLNIRCDYEFKLLCNLLLYTWTGWCREAFVECLFFSQSLESICNSPSWWTVLVFNVLQSGSPSGLWSKDNGALLNISVKYSANRCACSLSETSNLPSPGPYEMASRLAHDI